MYAYVRNPNFIDAVSDFQNGTSSPRVFLETCLEQIDMLEPKVKAFRHLAVENARAQADAATRRYRDGRPLSPIDGCPVAIKDIIETKDMPTGFGSPAFAGNATHRDAACVQALRAGGGVIIGKTVSTEFAIGFSGETTNPHDPSRTPGGSSSGSAAAVACGMVPVALGTQTNGSVLRPASYCGVIGFKGTFGVLPISGIHPVSLSHDHLGVLASGMDDLWATASWISSNVGSPGHPPLQGAGSAAPDPHKPARLIRLYLKGWDELDRSSRGAFEETMAAVKAKGVEVLDRTAETRVADLEALDADEPNPVSLRLEGGDGSGAF